MPAQYFDLFRVGKTFSYEISKVIFLNQPIINLEFSPNNPREQDFT